MVALILAGAFLTVAGLERVPRLRFRTAPLFRPFLLTDVGWYLLSTGSSAVSALVLGPVFAGLRMAPLADAVDRLPGSSRLAGALVVFDLVGFLVHVVLHRSDVLWSVHKVHHSSLHLDWLATTRTHMLEHLVRAVPAQLVLFAGGLAPADIAGVSAAYAFFALLGHSNLALDLRLLEPVFVTPRLHRRHHVPSSTQRNFATVFTFWDRLFGTLVRVDTTPEEEFGVPGERESYPQQLAAAFAQPARELRARRYARGPWFSGRRSRPNPPPSPSSASSGPRATT